MNDIQVIWRAGKYDIATWKTRNGVVGVISDSGHVVLQGELGKVIHVWLSNFDKHRKITW